MRVRFGTFEFDPAALELRRDGRPVKIEPQPAKALARLLAVPGALVTRDDLREAIWGRETHVDFDRGITYAIGQVRAALGDSGENPRFLQTLPKRGFRFVAPVVDMPEPAATARRPSGEAAAARRPGDAAVAAGAGGAAPAPAPITEPTTSPASRDRPAEVPPSGARRRIPRWFAPLAAALIIAVLGLGTLLWGRGAPPVVAVSIFDNETGDPTLDVPVATLTDLVVVRLTALAPGRLGVVGNAAVLRRPRNIRDLDAVAAGVQADYVVLGQLQRDPAGVRFVTHLVRLRDGVHLKANRLTVPAERLAALDASVPDEFARAVREHVLHERAPQAGR